MPVKLMAYFIQKSVKRVLSPKIGVEKAILEVK